MTFQRTEYPGKKDHETGQDAEQTGRVRKSVSHPFHSCQKLIDQATLEAAFFSHGQPRLPKFIQLCESE